jgi:hypothetical protein
VPLKIIYALIYFIGGSAGTIEVLGGIKPEAIPLSILLLSGYAPRRSPWLIIVN